MKTTYQVTIQKEPTKEEAIMEKENQTPQNNANCRKSTRNKTRMSINEINSREEKTLAAE